MKLCQLPAGTSGYVISINGNNDFCQKIREMGIFENVRVLKVSGTGPFIFKIHDTNFVLCHDAAEQITVCPI